MMLKLAITPGEPAGIGPDLVIKLAQEKWHAILVVFADKNMLEDRASLLGIDITLIGYQEEVALPLPAGSLYSSERRSDSRRAEYRKWALCRRNTTTGMRRKYARDV